MPDQIKIHAPAWLDGSVERIENYPAIGWEIRRIFLAFPPKAQKRMTKAGLLARLTFAGLLSRPDSYRDEKWHSGAKVLPGSLRGTDLQLRGQLRYRTGFPFHPIAQSTFGTGLGTLIGDKVRRFSFGKKAADHQ